MLLSVVAALVCTQSLIAQSVASPGAEAATKLKQYEVVSIKENKSIAESSSWMSTTDGFRTVNTDLRGMIAYAYGVRFDLVSGAPGWLASRKFDVEAKVAGADVEAYKKLDEKDQLPMVKALLQERLGLQAHIETKELPVYGLVVAKGGVKMKESLPDPPQSDPTNAKPDKPARHNGNMRMTWGTMSGEGFAMQRLANQISYVVHRTVLDKTRLTALYDFELKWTPEDVPQQDNGKETAPSIFTAVQEQLGLKLVSTKGPVDTLVIDHVELPSEN